MPRQEPSQGPETQTGEGAVEIPFRFADDLGPDKIVHLYEPSTGLRGIVVVDNVACGPSIGGVRMAPDVSLEECFRLARAMTLKNAAWRTAAASRSSSPSPGWRSPRRSASCAPSPGPSAI